MLDKVDAVIDLAVIYNRRFPQELKTVGRLEQWIKYLFSGCVTKIALEGKKYEFPDLGQFTTDKLFRMASYHYRKIDRALSEYIQEKNDDIDDNLLDMEFHFYNLLSRLRVTEVRINRYNSNRWYDDKVNLTVVGGLAFSIQRWNRTFIQDHLKQASFQHARAFFELGFICQLLGVRKEA